MKITPEQLTNDDLNLLVSLNEPELDRLIGRLCARINVLQSRDTPPPSTAASEFTQEMLTQLDAAYDSDLPRDDVGDLLVDYWPRISGALKTPTLLSRLSAGEGGLSAHMNVPTYADDQNTIASLHIDLEATERRALQAEAKLAEAERDAIEFEEGDAVKTQKTGARQRFLLTDDLRAILAEAKGLHGNVVGMYVIPGRQGKPIDRQTAGRWFRAAARAAGVKDARPQDVRAKAATDRDAEREGAATRLLGHTNPQTTRTYLRGKKVSLVEPMKRRGGGTI
jgi:integrase-like protein